MPEFTPSRRRFGEKVLDAVSGHWEPQELPAPAGPETPSAFWHHLADSVAGEWESGAPDAYSPGEGPGVTPPEDAPLAELLSWLQRNSVENLLDFRTHCALPKHVERRSCGCITVRDRVFLAARGQAINVELSLIVGFGDEDGAPSAAAVEAVRAMVRFLEERQQSERPLDIDLAELRALADDAMVRLRADDAADAITGSLASLVRDLDVFETILNEYSGVDLREFDLTKFRLVGMRWSNDTRWPRGWRRRMLRDSDRIAPGTFLVRGDDPLTHGPTDV